MNLMCTLFGWLMVMWQLPNTPTGNTLPLIVVHVGLFQFTSVFLLLLLKYIKLQLNPLFSIKS